FDTHSAREFSGEMEIALVELKVQHREVKRQNVPNNHGVTEARSRAEVGFPIKKFGFCRNFVPLIFWQIRRLKSAFRRVPLASNVCQWSTPVDRFLAIHDHPHSGTGRLRLPVPPDLWVSWGL